MWLRRYQRGCRGAAPGCCGEVADVTSAAPSGRDLRPLVVAVVDRGASRWPSSLAAARWGWLGPDVGRGDGFCEAARPGWIRQPANTWSNLGFVIAGLAIAWYAGERARLGVTLGAHPGLATAYAVLVVLLGPGLDGDARHPDRPRRTPRPAEHVPRVGLRPGLRPDALRAPRSGVPRGGVRGGGARRDGGAPARRQRAGARPRRQRGVRRRDPAGARPGGRALPSPAPGTAPGPVVRGRLGRRPWRSPSRSGTPASAATRGATRTPCCSSTASGTCSARCRPT